MTAPDPLTVHTSAAMTTRLVRTRGGRVIHLRGCRFATNGAPWNWAEHYDDSDIAYAIRHVGVRACRHCKPLGQSS